MDPSQPGPSNPQAYAIPDLNLASRPTRQRRKPSHLQGYNASGFPVSSSGPRPTKVKLNFSKKGVVGGRYSSFLGHYDREIDSDEEELEMEEHFVLRLPGEKEADELRTLLKGKGAGGKKKFGSKAAGQNKEGGVEESVEGVWFKFKDSRRAAFSLNNQLYAAKLIDLPSIVESQKTLDGKQMFKVADISQMLQVTHPIASEASLLSHATTSSQPTSTSTLEEYISPHGLTPPLRHVRKRRYRKRVSRRVIEIVEEEVERLLSEDSKAEKTSYELIENADPDLSDSEFLTPTGTPLPHGLGSEYDPSEYPLAGGSEFGGEGTMSRFGGTDGGDPAADGAGQGAGGDFDLAAELTRGLKALDNDEEEEDEDDDGEEDEDEEDEDEDDDEEGSDEEDGASAADSEDEEAVQLAQRQKLLNEEIRDLEAAVAKKRVEIEKSANPIIRKRFEDALRKLQADLDLKQSARATNVKEKEKRKREEEEEKERHQAFRVAEQERAAEVAAAAAGQAAGGGIDDEDVEMEDWDAPPPPAIPPIHSSSSSANNNSVPQQQQQQQPVEGGPGGIESLMAAGLDADSSEEDEDDLFGDDGTEDEDEGTEASEDGH